VSGARPCINISGHESLALRVVFAGLPASIPADHQQSCWLRVGFVRVDLKW
jgi:hypothetical protein